MNLPFEYDQVALGEFGGTTPTTTDFAKARVGNGTGADDQLLEVFEFFDLLEDRVGAALLEPAVNGRHVLGLLSIGDRYAVRLLSSHLSILACPTRPEAGSGTESSRSCRRFRVLRFAANHRRSRIPIRGPDRG